MPQRIVGVSGLSESTPLSDEKGLARYGCLSSSHGRLIIHPSGTSGLFVHVTFLRMLTRLTGHSFAVLGFETLYTAPISNSCSDT